MPSMKGYSLAAQCDHMLRALAETDFGEGLPINGFLGPEFNAGVLRLAMARAIEGASGASKRPLTPHEMAEGPDTALRIVEQDGGRVSREIVVFVPGEPVNVRLAADIGEGMPGTIAGEPEGGPPHEAEPIQYPLPARRDRSASGEP